MIGYAMAFFGGMLLEFALRMAEKGHFWPSRIGAVLAVVLIVLSGAFM